MKDRKKTKLKWIFWLLVALAAVSLCVILLLYTPAHYSPAKSEQDQISPYLTHELLPRFYNSLQRGEPFEMILVQQGINEIIAQFDWPYQYNGLTFSTPKVNFVPDSIELMGTVVIAGAELFVTITGEPAIDQNGLLNLHIEKVKAGAVNITTFARAITREIVAQQGIENIDPNSLEAQLAASLLDDKPFDPVFQIDGKKVKIQKITIEQKKLTIHLTPIKD